MATYYIDPSATFNGDGTLGTEATGAGLAGAYNTFVGITAASNNNYYVKRGTTFNFWGGVTLSRFQINALDNVLVGAYYLVGITEFTDNNTLEALPVLNSYGVLTTSGDWLEAETNVWIYDDGANFSEEIHMVGLGTLAGNLQMQAPYFDELNTTNDDAPGVGVFDTFGEWDSTFGYADIAINTITPGATTSIVLASGCEHQAGTQGMVLLSGITINSGVDINGWHLGTFSSTTAFTIAVDTTGSSYTGGTLDRGVKFAIYADANPVTKWGTVYIDNIQSKPMQVLNACDNITIEYLNFKHAYSGVNSQTGPVTDLTIRYCEYDNCWHAIKGGHQTNSFANGMVHDNTIINSRCTGIYVDGLQNGTRVYNNIVTNSGICNAYGCIYIASAEVDAATPYLIYNNTVSEILSTKVFKHEAYGIYPDSTSGNVHIFNNHVFNCGGVPRWTPDATNFAGGAFHCNSALSGIKFFSNIAENSYKGISFSNSGGDPNLLTHEVYNNLFIDIIMGLTASKIIGGTLTIQNNIFYNDGTGDYEGLYGIYLNADSHTTQVIQDYNLINGFTNVIFSGAIPLGSNSITTDPLIDADYYPHLDSPCIGAGCWTGAIRLDYGGRPFKRSKPTIGAWEIANRDPVSRSSRDPVNISSVELQPVITLEPETGLTVTAPTAYTLTVEATNALSYQWYYVSGDGLVPGGTSASLTVDPSVEGTWGYYCIATNVTLTAQTIDVFVTVNAA